ncbi:MAG: N-acetylglucosamine-6-phosphate deacetylase [Firmicutes bacterium]|nr:N-acetylglucosamine-6-phosphate deacetylase [Erysipelotrichaceae bacterium]MDD6525394.1 N-acetylglucosamine-6-phosphate deacetylase [Bacillota bacterium]MDD7227156.1 N-acetylglucosamine-6-phosphate deacetylase [Bacillota bacterium]MDY4973259.1 N-acetylglucosamine-6-phosphate deacetylase [Erysipelotrichaceae bacterium]
MIIQSKNVYVSGVFAACQIEVCDGKIVQIYPYGTKEVDADYGEDRVIPGMIDVHCHGGLGFDTNDANVEGLVKWAKGLLQEGITGFCPTTVTQSEEILTNAVANVAKVVKEGYEGAEILGIHFEGPYLNMKNKGAQPPEYIVTPNVEQFKKYQEAANGLIKIITMATENDPDFALTRYCAANGVNVSIGHSGATYDDAVLAVLNGANGMTHTYNGMNGLHHREPALVGAAMNLKDTYAEIICDGNHVVWPAIRALITSKGRDYCIMIDDALCAKGCAPGYYELGGNAIEIRANGSAYLQGTNTLAGGTLKFNKGLQNLVEKVMIPIDWAINMCTINPARYLGVDDHKGKIMAGYDADMVVLDRDYEVVQVYAKGKAVK